MKTVSALVLSTAIAVSAAQSPDVSEPVTRRGGDRPSIAKTIRNLIARVAADWPTIPRP
jgi:opacity protein-like surface antigen